MCNTSSIMGGIPSSLPSSAKQNNDGFTLSQLTKLFNAYRREFGIRCHDEAD